MKPIRLMVLAGGRSDEHPISLLSARSLQTALAGQPFSLRCAIMARDGRWLGPDQADAALGEKEVSKGTLHPSEVASLLADADVIFPLIHGPYGEDGRLQGFLETLDVPYIGSHVLGSAVCMDKRTSKYVLQANQIPQVAFVATTKEAFAQDPQGCLTQIAKAMPGPFFVKPANLGSSVGISKVSKLADLPPAIALAGRYDRHIVIEQAVPKPRELEIALLGNAEVACSVVGEITYQAEFYDYETKYTDGRAQMHIPADIDAALRLRIEKLAKAAYAALSCRGFARVDFLYDAQGDALYLNEINTLPGFTPFSMFPLLWQASGLSYPKLIAKLVDLARSAYSEQHS